MTIEFLFIGKTTEKWVEEGIAHYLNRIKHYVKAEIKVFNVASSGASPAIQKKKESALILEKIAGKDLVVLLDEKGKQFSSEAFAVQLNKLITSGKSKVLFIIGGAYGSDDALKERADLLLSFSNMTFTHQMIRPILLEQVYRACSILKNEKYHH